MEELDWRWSSQWPSLLLSASFLPLLTPAILAIPSKLGTIQCTSENFLFLFILAQSSTAQTEEPIYTLLDLVTSLPFLLYKEGSLRPFPPLTFYSYSDRTSPSRHVPPAQQIN